MRGKSSYSIKRTFDKKLIKELHDQIFPSDDFPESDSFDWVVRDHHGKPVGFCMLSIVDDDTGYLSRAGLLKEAYGKGLHLRLIRVREKFLRIMGFTMAISYTKIYNISSSYNLQKAGYWVYIPENEYADPDCIYWRKSLVKVKGKKSVKR